MKNLKAYIEQKNTWQILFSGKTEITFPLSQSDVKSLTNSLDSDLSPENLHCDGEITARQAQAKYKMYSRVVAELEAYCKANTLTMPMVEELY
jgi:hypothetical protein